MRRLGWQWWLALATLTVLFLLVRLPASMLGSLIAGQTDGKLTLVAAQGSLWEGSAQPVLQGMALAEKLSWQWQPKALLKGRLAYDIQLDQGQAQLILGWHQLGLQDARLGVAAAPLFQLDPRSRGYGLGGQLWLSSPAFNWSSNAAPQGQLVLEWRGAVSSLVPNIAPLGDYRATLTPTGQGWQWQLQTQTGQLQLGGNGSWQPAQGLTADIGVRAAPGSEAALSPFLNQIGPGAPDAERRLRFNFR